MTKLIQILLASATLFGGSLLKSVAAENPRQAESQAEAPEESARAEAFLKQFQWTKGPGTASIGGLAKIDVPVGFMFTGPEGTQKILRAWGNPTGGDEKGLLAPADLEWSVIFEFAEVGYVKDSDKDRLDGDKLLKSIKEGTERSNKLREKMGAPALHVTGWEKPPTYNAETHNLEWAIRGQSAGHAVVNYNTRLLGRKGVMSVTLLVAPDKMSETIPQYQALLKSYSFQDGERYAEYRQGDKIAKYGLTALVVGGAAVGAAKLGLFAWLAVLLKKAWKLVVFAVVAVVAGIRRLLFGPSGRTETR